MGNFACSNGDRSFAAFFVRPGRLRQATIDATPTCDQVA
jgi:hypothetical protein